MSQGWDDNIQRRELEKRLGTVGVDALNLTRLEEQLDKLVHEAFETVIGENIGIESVYIVGSYAEGEAIPSASDLDIRIVPSSNLAESQRRAVSEYVDEHWRDYFSNERNFGFIDTQCHNTPPQDIPAKELYL